MILLDGTLSSLQAGHETHIRRIFNLLLRSGSRAHLRLYYEPGSQWQGWRHGWNLVQGRGIDAQIMRAYGWLASHYRPGDRIFLLGYSRGAYAVRSLAGVIDRVGLLRHEQATERGVRLIWRHYRTGPDRAAARAFAGRFCYALTTIQMVGVFDTVKSMGVRLPLVWMVLNDKTSFHNHNLGRAVRHGFHALALDETRLAFEPVLWTSPPGWSGNVEQMWFRGAHGDVGGQIGATEVARPLSNIPLIWMLDRAAAAGLPLAPDWRAGLATDVNAPMIGTWRSWGKFFLLRRRRRVGMDPSEHLHPSLAGVRRRNRLSL